MTEKHICYLCNKDIKNKKEELPIPFAEEGIVCEMWHVHIKCYEDAILSHMQDKRKEKSIKKKQKRHGYKWFPDEDCDYPIHHWVRYSPFELIDEDENSKWKIRTNKDE